MSPVKPPSTRAGELTSHEAEELVLYIDNDAWMYAQKKPFLENVRRKLARGTYDPALAPKLWVFYAERGARRYGKEILGSERAGLAAFSTAVRREVAAHYARQAEEELGFARHDQKPQHEDKTVGRRSPVPSRLDRQPARDPEATPRELAHMSRGKRILVYWVNLGWYADRWFRTVEEAKAYVKAQGYEARIETNDGLILGTWSPIGGFSTRLAGEIARDPTTRVERDRRGLFVHGARKKLRPGQVTRLRAGDEVAVHGREVEGLWRPRDPEILVREPWRDPARAGTRVCPVGTEVQTLVFHRREFPRRELAVGWAAEHGFVSGKVDATDTSFRLRQQPPRRFQARSFRVIDITRGVRAVVGCPKRLLAGRAA